jgi:molybdate transport system permease protein
MFAPLTPAEWTAIALSLRVAVVAAVVSLPVGIALAYALARGRFPGRTLLDGIVYLPLVVPPVATGYLLLLAFGRRGPVGAFLESTFGIVFAFNWTGAALASAIMALPLMVQPIRLSLEGIDRRLEAAASTLGASRPGVLATVTLPLAAPGILVGLVLGFARALGEFGATITFVGNIPGVTQTLPSAIHTYIDSTGGGPAALRLSLISIAIAFSALLASNLIGRRIARRVAGI